MKPAYHDAIVLVTGASTGLGRAIAVGAAQRGARAIVINYAHNLEAAAEAGALVRAAGAEAVLVKGDVGVDEDCLRIAASAECFGRIDTLFNNAGISRAVQGGDLNGLDADDFLSIYRVNVVGAFQMLRAARQLLLASDSAAVVNTSSIAGITGGGSSIAYSASKGALNTMTRSLARAVAPEIRVNAICPGFIDTPWFDKLGTGTSKEALLDHMRKITPLRTVSSANDIAETALFLGSAAARHVTGETLLADGGLHLA